MLKIVRPEWSRVVRVNAMSDTTRQFADNERQKSLCVNAVILTIEGMPKKKQFLFITYFFYIFNPQPTVPLIA